MVFVYQDKESKTYKQAIKMLMKNKFKGSCLSSPVSLYIKFLYKDKKSEKGEFKPHIKKPDIDNLAKGILDACNKIVYKDDCLVYRLLTEKFYGHENDHIEFHIQSKMTPQQTVIQALTQYNMYELARKIDISWRTLHRIKKGEDNVSQPMKINVQFKIKTLLEA